MNRGLHVAVLGAGGVAGGELLRLLLGHPAIETIVPASSAAGPVDRVHPNLMGCGLRFCTVDDALATAPDLDFAFLALPSGHAMGIVGDLLDAGVRVVDLSADFRFPDERRYEAVYGAPHLRPDLLPAAVYGVTEFARDAIRSARLVANPGCYVVTALLTLVPLLRAGVVDPNAPVSIHATNGTSGAGRAVRSALLHANAAEDVLAYSLEGHRHAPEMEDRLAAIAGEDVCVDLTTAHGPFARGIHLQASVRADERIADTITRGDVCDLYANAYGRGGSGEFFVRIVEGERPEEVHYKAYELYPSVARVRGSNYCHIGCDYDRRVGRIRAVGVIDNLVKGAAGSAIQNMNVMADLPEQAGLDRYGT